MENPKVRVFELLLVKAEGRPHVRVRKRMEKGGKRDERPAIDVAYTDDTRTRMSVHGRPVVRAAGETREMRKLLRRH